MLAKPAAGDKISPAVLPPAAGSLPAFTRAG
jgi:hypothetical protein